LAQQTLWGFGFAMLYCNHSATLGCNVLGERVCLPISGFKLLLQGLAARVADNAVDAEHDVDGACNVHSTMATVMTHAASLEVHIKCTIFNQDDAP
jgi:hypothetical protein